MLKEHTFKSGKKKLIYAAPPPSYPPILNEAKEPSNLFSHYLNLDCSDERFGRVLGESELKKTFSCCPKIT